MSDSLLTDRALGCLLGLAVGDAVGSTLEFAERDRHPPVTDMVGGGPFGLRPGEWTDDTSMALCLADSLIACGGLDQRDVMERFVRWWREGENSHNGLCFDIGFTTRKALQYFVETGDPIAGSIDPETAGNGSIMRLAPVALRWAKDPQKTVSAARMQSATTHGAAKNARPSVKAAMSRIRWKRRSGASTGLAASPRRSCWPRISRMTPTLSAP